VGQENPHQTPVTTVLALPMYQTMPVPNQSVFVSSERLCLGTLFTCFTVTGVYWYASANTDR
jgi:hypothetical protein